MLLFILKSFLYITESCSVENFAIAIVILIFPEIILSYILLAAILLKFDVNNNFTTWTKQNELKQIKFS